MAPRNLRTFKALTSDILEEVCFLLPARVGLEEEPAAQTITVHIACGNTTDLYLEFDARLAKVITGNFLGKSDEETSIDSTMVTSSIMEIGNMVGGNYMNALDMPPDTHLSPPEIVESPWSDARERVHYSIATDTIFAEGYPIHLMLVEHLL